MWATAPEARTNFQVPYEQARTATDAALQREAAFGAELNRKLRAAMDQAAAVVGRANSGGKR